LDHLSGSFDTQFGSTRYSFNRARGSWRDNKIKVFGAEASGHLGTTIKKGNSCPAANASAVYLIGESFSKKGTLSSKERAGGSFRAEPRLIGRRE
jgi:hypothetical protein